MSKDAAQEFVTSSACPYAQNARITTVEWARPDLTAAKVKSLSLSLEDFCKSSDDLLLLALADTAEVSLNDWAKWLAALLERVAQGDTIDQANKFAGVEDQDWHFSWGGNDFFLPLFASCYPLDHPRASGREYSFLLFQSKRSFTRFQVSSKDRQKRTALSKAIRERFEAQGRPYSEKGMRLPIAYRFIKPIRDGDPPIKWWKHLKGAVES